MREHERAPGPARGAQGAHRVEPASLACRGLDRTDPRKDVRVPEGRAAHSGAYVGRSAGRLVEKDRRCVGGRPARRSGNRGGGSRDLPTLERRTSSGGGASGFGLRLRPAGTRRSVRRVVYEECSVATRRREIALMPTLRLRVIKMTTVPRGRSCHIGQASQEVADAEGVEPDLI